MGDSPAKRLDFASTGKENKPVSGPLPPAEETADLNKPIAEMIKTGPEPPKVAPGIKATEVDEPLLQENPHRFVLFPIKYHEVGNLDATRYALCASDKLSSY